MIVGQVIFVFEAGFKQVNRIRVEGTPFFLLRPEHFSDEPQDDGGIVDCVRDVLCGLV